MMFTAIQKISISIISVMCILMAVFGIFNKQSYNSITTDNLLLIMQFYMITPVLKKKKTIFQKI